MKVTKILHRERDQAEAVKEVMRASAFGLFNEWQVD